MPYRVHIVLFINDVEGTQRRWSPDRGAACHQQLEHVSHLIRRWAQPITLPPCGNTQVIMIEIGTIGDSHMRELCFVSNPSNVSTHQEP